MDNINTRTGVMIAAYRKKLNMSQLELAEQLSLTRTSISNIERGKQALSLTMFCAVSELLHISPDLFLKDILKTSHAKLTEEDVSDPWIRQLINNTLEGKELMITERDVDEQKKN